MSGTAEIISYTVETGIDEKALALSNAEAARKLEVGTNYTKIRIAFMFTFDESPSGANYSDDTKFAFGLINDPSNGIGAATTDHFLGFQLNKDSTDGITYTGGDTVYINTSANHCDFDYIVNGAESTSTALSTVDKVVLGDFNNNKKEIVAFDVERGSPDWTITLYADTNNLSPGDSSETDMDEGLILQNPNSEWVTASEEFTVTAPDEATHGNLDHVAIYYQNTTTRIIVPTIKVARFA